MIAFITIIFIQTRRLKQSQQMQQQNKKNGNLIVIKKRRILTRTEQSRQKLQTNLNTINTNNSLFKTPKPKSSKIIKLSQQQKSTQHQNINSDQIIFWNIAKKKNIQGQFQNRQKTQSLIEFLSPKKHINQNDHQKPQTKCASKMFGIFKKKMFSHKTLREGVGKIKSNISESLLRINNQESVQNETSSKKNFQMEDSEDGTERKYNNLMRIREFTKRFKTEDTERDVNMQRVIQSIYSNRRRKLRLHSNQFSVELRIKRKSSKLQQEEGANARQQGSITMRTSNHKSLLKLPNQLNAQIHRNKSKTLTAHHIPKIDQQQQITQIESVVQPQNQQQTKKDDRRFIKKQPYHHVQDQVKPVQPSQTISIQDIQVVCFNDIQEIDLASQNIKEKSSNYKIDNKRKAQKITQNIKQVTKTQQISESKGQKRVNQVQSYSEKEIKPINPNITQQPIQYQLTKPKQNERVKQTTNQQATQQLIRRKSQIQSLNFIGEVGGECSQLFPKKNLSWMVPTLLLYTYCLNFRISTKNIFQQAFKSQLLDENSLQQFLEQNQQLQQSITKIYQKTKKKAVLSSQIQYFLLPSLDFRKEKSNLIQKSYIQIVGFLNLFLKNQQKKSLNYRECLICAIKMIRAFLLVLKIEFQQKVGQGEFRLTQLKKKQMFTLPEINLENLGQKQSNRLLDMEFKLMKENFDIFCQFMVK